MKTPLRFPGSPSLPAPLFGPGWVRCLRHALLLSLLLSSLPSLAQTTRYVKETAAGTRTGSSWENASGDLQAMINASKAGDQVWVARGQYKPTSGTDRTISFSMKEGVAIYGGYRGNLGDFNERTSISLTTPSSTTLSGDLGNTGKADDNSYHVIKNPPGLTEKAILDGFVITGGYADRGANADDYGGGILSNYGGDGKVCSPTIQNCWFENNFAKRRGGAIYNFGHEGGTSNPKISNCRFQNNTADEEGGAIYNDGYRRGESSPQLTNCSFQNNNSRNGGAIFNSGPEGNSNPTLTSCSFQGNSAITNGGAIFNDGLRGTSSPKLVNCSFQDNKATGDGGGVYNYSVFNGNSNPTLTNCSFQNNRATSEGGAMFNNANGGVCSPTLVNCVFYGNGAANSIAVLGSGVAQATYCLFDASVNGDGYTAGGTGNKTTTTSPFASPDGTQLACGSPAVNAGKTDTPGLLNMSTDLAGKPRIYDGQVDMGAYELQGDGFPKRLYVSANGTNTNPATATTWATATKDLQGAINSLCSSFPAEIWVAKGLYKPTTDNDRQVSFSMKNNIAIYGGFDGTEANLSQRPAINLTTPSSTTLSGDIGTPGNFDDNSYHVINNPRGLTNSAILDGFVITGGNANGGGGANNPNDYGGGNIQRWQQFRSGL